MATLYVTTPGAYVEKEYKRILVTVDDEVILRVPLFRITQLVLVGHVGITIPATQALLRNNIGLLIITRQGKLLGRLVPSMVKNITLRQKQYERAQDAAFCLSVSRAFIYGKIRNAATMVTRLRRNHPEIEQEISIKLRKALDDIKGLDDLASLRGIEGSAARLYFLGFRQAIRRGWQFEKRSHHPPEDEINALLGLGYTLLYENMITALEIVGLDPYDGFLHADKYGRPALALDLMEEFRSIIADSVVLNLVNRRIVTQKDFSVEGKRYTLQKRGLDTFFRAYQKRIQTEVRHPLTGRKLSYQKIFEVQAACLRKAIEGKGEYESFISK